MRISFSPSLGETVIATVAPDAESVRLRFTATFASQTDYEAAVRGDVRVEVWTDLLGHWGELAFTPEPPPSSLLTNEYGHHHHTLSLTFPARLSRQTQFAFTYRLVYPSGRIEWLGDFGRDGFLLIERRADPRFVLTEGWRTLEDGSLVWDTPGPPGEQGQVGRVNPAWDWSFWAIDDTNTPRLHTLDEPFSAASAVYFLPRTDSVVVLEPFAMRASHDSTLSLTRRGGILFTRSKVNENVLHLDTLRPHDLLTCRRVFTDSHFLVSADDNNTVLTVIPLSPTRSEVHVPVQTLAALVPDFSAFSVFSRSTSSYKTFSASQSTDSVPLLVGPHGGHFVLSPIHTPPAREEDKVQIPVDETTAPPKEKPVEAIARSPVVVLNVDSMSEGQLQHYARYVLSAFALFFQALLVHTLFHGDANAKSISAAYPKRDVVNEKTGGDEKVE